MAERKDRAGPLDGRAPLIAGDRLRIEAAALMARFLVRGGEEVRAAASDAFGVALSRDALRAGASAVKAALWLGPDEWLLIAPETDALALMRRLRDALRGLPHALTDVSHRQTALVITGALAADVLNSGCPLDLDLEAFPPGMCTRTLLAKAEVVLWRTAPARFHVEVARSLAAYAWAFLAEAAREHMASGAPR